MDTPVIDKKTVQDLLDIGKERAIAVSAGRLNDFSPASPVVAILEAVAKQGETVLSAVNGLASTLEKNRIALFGLEKQTGTKAIGRIGVRLDGLYGESFVLPEGFNISINGLIYETVDSLAIAAYTDYAEVNIVCTVEGDRGNASSTVPVSFPSLRKLGTITLVGAVTGGRNEESDLEFQQRVYGLLQSRDTLISEEDFVRATIDFLGIGSTAIALGRMKADQATFANGYVGVFGLNPDGSTLNTAQISALTNELNSVSAMATINVWSIQTFTINVDVVAGVNTSVLPKSIASAIAENIKAYLKPGNLPPGDSIYNKAIEARIQSTPGVLPGIVNVELNQFAMPATMPNRWTVGKLGNLTVTLTFSDRTIGQITYEY